jgi:hypothetical protein
MPPPLEQQQHHQRRRRMLVMSVRNVLVVSVLLIPIIITIRTILFYNYPAAPVTTMNINNNSNSSHLLFREEFIDWSNLPSRLNHPHAEKTASSSSSSPSTTTTASTTRKIIVQSNENFNHTSSIENSSNEGIKKISNNKMHNKKPKGTTSINRPNHHDIHSSSAIVSGNKSIVMMNQHQSSLSMTKNHTRIRNYYPYAYAFIVAGCNPQRPTYRFYLYNVRTSCFFFVLFSLCSIVVLQLFSFCDMFLFVLFVWFVLLVCFPDFLLRF